METIKIKDFTGSCFGLFMEGEFVCSDDWQAMREQAVWLIDRRKRYPSRLSNMKGRMKIQS